MTFRTVSGWLCAIAASGFLATRAPSADTDLSCIQPREEGRWRNADPNTRSLTRAELRFVCQDQILNGEPYPPGPPWYMHLWGKCHPSDCDWGERGGQQLNSGHIYVFFNQGFARRHVYARMSQYRPGQLWIYMYTDFVNPNRPDYESHNWFVRQP